MEASQPLRVMIVADSPGARTRLQAIIEAHPAFELVFSVAGAPRQFVDADGPMPDVLLIELEPRGEAAVKAPLDLGPRLPAVILIDEADRDWAVDAWLGEATAILTRTATAAEIVAAIECAAAGLVVLSPDLVAYARASITAADPQAATNLPDALTPRELDALRMLAEGLGNKQIARQLDTSEHTVKFHVSSILGKLGAASRTEAVMLGIRQGLVML